MRCCRILLGLLLLILPRVLHAQDAPTIMIDDITDARGEKVDETNAPFIIHITGKVFNAMHLYVYIVVDDSEAAWIQSTVGLGYMASQNFDFLGHCTLGMPNEPLYTDKRYIVFAIVSNIEYERYQKLDATTVVAKSNEIVLFRPVSTPQPAPTPQPVPIPQPVPTLQSGITASITSPRPGARVDRKIPVEGFISGLRPHHYVFLCLKSLAFGRLIYPQGQVTPDATGKWMVESIYATTGYSYETFLVVTTNTASAAMLNDQQARKYGMPSLPPDTERVGTTLIVTRE